MKKPKKKDPIIKNCVPGNSIISYKQGLEEGEIDGYNKACNDWEKWLKDSKRN